MSTNNTKTNDVENEALSSDPNELKVLRYEYDLRKRAEREISRGSLNYNTGNIIGEY